MIFKHTLKKRGWHYFVHWKTSMWWNYLLTTIRVNGSVRKSRFFQSGNRRDLNFDSRRWVKFVFLFKCLLVCVFRKWTCLWDNEMTPRPSRLLYVRDRKVHTPSTRASLNRFSETKVPICHQRCPLVARPLHRSSKHIKFTLVCKQIHWESTHCLFLGIPSKVYANIFICTYTS